MGSSYFCRICTLCVMSHSRILKMCVTGESLGKISQRVVRVTFFIVFSPYDQEKYMKERGGGGGLIFFVCGGTCNRQQKICFFKSSKVWAIFYMNICKYVIYTTCYLYYTYIHSGSFIHYRQSAMYKSCSCLKVIAYLRMCEL